MRSEVILIRDSRNTLHNQAGDAVTVVGILVAAARCEMKLSAGKRCDPTLQRLVVLGRVGGATGWDPSSVRQHLADGDVRGSRVVHRKFGQVANDRRLEVHQT